MDSKTKKNLLDNISNNLNIILSNTDEFEKALSNENFSNIISKNINMISQLEEKSKKKTSTDLQKKFNLILKNKINSIETTTYQNEYEFNDEIQYLKIYLQNSFNINIDDFKVNKNKINKIEEKKKDVNEQQQQQNSFAQNSSFTQNAYVNPEVFRETLISQMINKRISDDYVKGNYYFFVTKPKIIPILKLISGVFLIIVGLLFIAQIITTIMMTNANLYLTKKEGGDVPIVNSSIVAYLLLAFQAFILIYSGFSFMKKTPNDNFKYKPNNLIYYLLCFIGIISIYTPINYISILIPNISAYSKNTAYGIEVFKAMSYITLTTNILLILFIVFPILNYVYKPQENKELRAMLYQKYRKEIEDLGLVK